MIVPPDAVIIGYDDDTWEPLIAYKNDLKGDQNNESEQEDHSDAGKTGSTSA